MSVGLARMAVCLSISTFAQFWWDKQPLLTMPMATDTYPNTRLQQIRNYFLNLNVMNLIRKPFRRWANPMDIFFVKLCIEHLFYLAFATHDRGHRASCSHFVFYLPLHLVTPVEHITKDQCRLKLVPGSSKHQRCLVWSPGGWLII